MTIEKCKVVIITITNEILHKLLELPDNVKIKNVISRNMEMTDGGYRFSGSDIIRIKLQGEKLPYVPKGGQIEEISMEQLLEICK